MIRLGALGCLVLSLCSIPVLAQTDTDLRKVGKVHPRSAMQIASSSWSIGGETLDRDFAIYANYKKYLGPLGAKGIRLQAGWAKCEKVRGIYDWAWLDEPVNDSLAQGVQPWLELSYGNPIYPGGGDIGLGGGFPASPEALAAWDLWVKAIVERYKDRVTEWEIWNEPDGNHNGTATAEAYTDLYIRTATIIRLVQPKAKIYALALAGTYSYADTFLNGMTARHKLDLIDALTIHAYPQNPDSMQDVIRIQKRVAETGAPIQVREGETGAPSKYQEHFALSRIPWSETTQAKWDLRRLLVFHGMDIPMNLFTIVDMRYQRDGQIQMNYKGMLATKDQAAEMNVVAVKPAYYAAQNVFSIFDDTLVRVKDFAASAPQLALCAYRKNGSGAPVVAVWRNDAKPVDPDQTAPVDLVLTGLHFKNPVYVDLLSGKVYALPKPSDGFTFKQVPIYDSPILIAEKSAIAIDAKVKE